MDDFMHNFISDFSALDMENFRRFCFEKIHQYGIEEKMKLTHEYLKTMGFWSTLPQLRNKSVKSATAAAELRRRGNLAFGAKNYSDALKWYTESIAFAPTGSQELAFAYANRSAVLISVGKHLDCLLDINRAFKENYPVAGKQKLIDRKNKSVAFLRNVINLYKLSPGFIQSFGNVRDVDQFIKEFSPEMTDLPYELPVPKVNFKNKLIPNASEKIKMINTQDNKKGIVATANIKPGEIIAIEKPVAWNLSEPNTRSSHCANCFCLCDALIHCPNCAVVMFCSARCRDNAFGLFHRVECQILCQFPLDFANKWLSNLTIIRVVLVITKQGEELDKIMDNPAYKQPLTGSFSHNVKKVFNSQDFSSVLGHGKSTCNSNSVDFNAGFDLSTFRVVLFWLYHLKQSSFFGDQTAGNQNFDGSLTDRELFVATLFLKLLRTITFQYLRQGLREAPGFGNEFMSMPIGHGLFPLINIFKHSCEPHAYLYSHENNLVCRSIRPIKADEEIFICYWRQYYRCPRYERLATLREKYGFDCTCRPCQHNWPVIEMLPVRFPKVISDNIGTRKFEEYSSRFQKLMERLDLDELSTFETFEFLREYSSILDKRFEKPCREFIECERLLDLSMSLSGNFYRIMQS